MDDKEKVIRKLRSHGMKITPQRMAIVDVLEGNVEHPSAEDVYKELAQKYPTISYATIYKTLETLREIGELVEVNIDPHKKRYDPLTEPHHHFRCVSCGRIEDISPKEVPMPPIHEKVQKKYGIVSVCIYFHGLCSACRN